MKSFINWIDRSFIWNSFRDIQTEKYPIPWIIDFDSNIDWNKNCFGFKISRTEKKDRISKASVERFSDLFLCFPIIFDLNIDSFLIFNINSFRDFNYFHINWYLLLSEKPISSSTQMIWYQNSYQIIILQNLSISCFSIFKINCRKLREISIVFQISWNAFKVLIN